MSPTSQTDLTEKVVPGRSKRWLSVLCRRARGLELWMQALWLRRMIPVLLQISFWHHFRMRRCGMPRPGKRSNSGNGPNFRVAPSGHQRGQVAGFPTTGGAKVEERVRNSPHQRSVGIVSNFGVYIRKGRASANGFESQK